MAYIQTTNRLIHVKESLQKLKNQLFKKHSQIITNFDFITVNEVIPEIDVLESKKILIRVKDIMELHDER